MTAELRIADGALVVADCIEGCAVQTETVRKQSPNACVKPCLVVNKIDRCTPGCKVNAEEVYGKFRNAIVSMVVIITTYNEELTGDGQVVPDKGTVAFGNGFNTERFAVIYAA